jgi:hypothetical protein
MVNSFCHGERGRDQGAGEAIGVGRADGAVRLWRLIKYNQIVAQLICCDNIMLYGLRRHSRKHGPSGSSSPRVAERAKASCLIDLRLSNELHDNRERAEMLRQMLDLLTSDGYLVRQEDAVRFRSALLRRYWREVQG